MHREVTKVCTVCCKAVFCASIQNFNQNCQEYERYGWKVI